MALADTLANFVCDLRLQAISPNVVSQARTLVLDALACMVAGAGSASATTAMAAIHPPVA